MFCPNCGSKLEKNVKFCGECGEQIPFPQPPAIQSVRGCAESMREPAHNPNPVNELDCAANFVSDKPKVIKEKNKKTKSGAVKKFIPLITVGAVVLVAIVTILNIHTCEECDEVYFGVQNKISFLGETEKVCQDCYDDFYDLSSWF